VEISKLSDTCFTKDPDSPSRPTTSKLIYVKVSE